MERTDITTQLLRDIRDEIRSTREELSARIEGNSERIDALSGRIVESEIRVAIALTELAGAVGDVKTLLAANLVLGPRVDQCERDIAALKAKVGA